MKTYVLVNKDGEFLCKKAGKIYASKTDLINVLFYKYPTNLGNRIQDKAYWEHRNIKINDFKPTPYKLSLTPIDK